MVNNFTRNEEIMDIKHIRTRWAAIGAAVAITLGAGGIGIVSATSPSGAVTYVPVEPCRLADTRAGASNVGPRDTPIGADETLVVIAEGANGECVGIPASATGLQLNVTSVNATAPTFLTIWGSGSQPNASSLNPTPGQPPTPNAVTAGLTAGGAINIYNLAGTVEVIVDIVGYYTDHTHTGDDIVDGSLSNVDTSNEPGIAYTNENSTVGLTVSAATVSTVRIRPPSTGYVTVNASAFWFSSSVGRQILCQITDGTSAIDGGEVTILDTDPEVGSFGHQISGTQTFPVVAYTGLILTGQPFNLVCNTSGGTATISDIHMTATFFATSYAPLVLIPFP